MKVGTRKSLISAAIMIAIIAVGCAGYLVYRHRRIMELYKEASKIQFGTAVVQTDELSHFSGKWVTQLLLQIAADPDVDPNNAAVAIHALAHRGDASVGEQLAEIVQPQTGPGIRKDIVEALEKMPCDSRCIESILHYFERTWLGLPNGKDPEGLSMDGLPPGIVREENKEESEVDEEFYQLLDKNALTTVHVLVDVYALGYPNPSEFGLHMVKTLKLKESCPWLRASYVNAVRNADSQNRIKDVMASIGCFE